MLIEYFFLISVAFCLDTLTIDGAGEIKDMTNLQITIADYGFVPYGTTMRGALDLANPIDLCNDGLGSTTTSTMSVSTSQSSHSTTTQTSSSQKSKFLVARRGTCFFSDKTLRAQQQGYKMLVIVDNVDEGGKIVNLVALTESQEIDIPSIMVTKSDGDRLISYLQTISHEDIFASITFPTLTKSQIVSYQYEFNAMNVTDYRFLSQFYSFQRKMEKSLKFQPYYFGYYNKTVECNSEYCAPDPDAAGPLTDNDALVEIVRQLCIHQIDEIKWWNYIVQFGSSCFPISSSCRQGVITKVGLNNQDIEKCIDNSYATPSSRTGYNNLLAFYFKETSRPILQVNGNPILGSLTVSDTLHDSTTGADEVKSTDHYGPLWAICKSFTDGSIPSLCSQLLAKSEIGSQSGDDSNNDSSPGGTTTSSSHTTRSNSSSSTNSSSSNTDTNVTKNTTTTTTTTTTTSPGSGGTQNTTSINTTTIDNTTVQITTKRGLILILSQVLCLGLMNFMI